MTTIFGSQEMVEVPDDLLPQIEAEGLAYPCHSHDDDPRWEMFYDDENSTEEARLERIDVLLGVTA